MTVPSDSATSRRRVLSLFCVFYFLGGNAAPGHSPGGNCFAGGIGLGDVASTTPSSKTSSSWATERVAAYWRVAAAARATSRSSFASSWAMSTPSSTSHIGM